MDSTCCCPLPIKRTQCHKHFASEHEGGARPLQATSGLPIGTSRSLLAFDKDATHLEGCHPFRMLATTGWKRVFSLARYDVVSHTQSGDSGLRPRRSAMLQLLTLPLAQ
eukprot:5939425-Amphidinium_carterae.1